jgi:TetR/AcrR family acrAB operon transcriptional repressor
MYKFVVRRTKEEAAATRAAVLRAALDVFGDRGYAAATLAEVAERADVTRGAVYHHFADKADLFLATVAEHWAALEEPLWATLDADDEPLERVRRFIVTYLEPAERDERLRRLLEVLTIRVESLPELRAGLDDKRAVFEEWSDRLATVLREADRRGDLRDGVAPRQAAALAITLMNGVTTTWLLAPEVLRPAAMAEAVGDAWVRGVGRP